MALGGLSLSLSSRVSVSPFGCFDGSGFEPENIAELPMVKVKVA